MKKILICEDDKDLLYMFSMKFKKDGWDVKTARDGEEGLEQIEKNDFDLVLLDLMMPKKTGFQVLEELRANPIYRDLPIIVLSGLDKDEDIKKALSLGANDYFVKSQHPLGEIIEKASRFSISASNAAGKKPAGKADDK